MTHDLFEIMRTTRSMRYLKPDPVPNALLTQVLEAGTQAASGGNMQARRFLVIRDQAIKDSVSVFYRRAWHEVVGPRYRAGGPAPGTTAERFARMLTAAEHLADHCHEAPVWIVPCQPGPREAGASVFPAVQNMLLAARALGLGCTLTSMYLIHAREAEAAMGLPEDVHSYAILPLGFPVGKFGPVRRAPLQDVVFADKWGHVWHEA